MEKEVQERFERIESVLERIATAHMDLEAAQLNQARAHEKLVVVVTNLGERIGDLTILVNQLIERDLGRS
jgi:hypothetical protein